jgi:hypothetical protein
LLYGLLQRRWSFLIHHLGRIDKGEPPRIESKAVRELADDDGPILRLWPN